MPPGGIRTHNVNRRAAVDLRLRPRGHWDRPAVPTIAYKTRVRPALDCGGELLAAASDDVRKARQSTRQGA